MADIFLRAIHRDKCRLSFSLRLHERNSAIVNDIKNDCLNRNISHFLIIVWLKGNSIIKNGLSV